MANYFETFALQQYGEKKEVSRMLTTRANIAQSVLKQSSVFYPYTLQEGERPDTLSYLYYSKPELEWLLFFANDIVDPYYDWYLNGEQFNNYVASKYGSTVFAQTRTRHYETIWIGDDTRISPSTYSILTANTTVNLKKYWEPIIDEYDRAVSYGRKKLSLITTTNQVISLKITNTNGTFVEGEDIYQQDNGIITSSASLLTANSTYFTAQHVTGSFITTRSIQGADSTANTTLTNTPVVIKQNIPTEELIYWQPVSYYDYENQINESKKHIKLVGAEYAPMAENNLNELMG
jgi:hypothetical protein